MNKKDTAESNKPLSRIELSILGKTILGKRRKKNHNRIIVYLGNSRLRGRVDYGLELIQKLEDDGHYIAGVMLEADDPVLMYPQVRIKKQIILPPQMCKNISEIRRHIHEDNSFKEEFQILLDTITYCQADLGIVFYGYWVPPEIFSIPKLGFINYHPGPLPYLRGMEPDTFAVLEGWKKIWGTVHRVDHSFDTGNILTRTRMIPLSPYETPVSVLRKLTRAGNDAIRYAVKHINNPVKNLGSIDQEAGSHATLKKAYQHSFIDWKNDSHNQLDRKLRAFCGQDIGIRLKTWFDGECYSVYDLILFKGRFPGTCGQIIGYYMDRGNYMLQPIVKTVEGVALLLIGEALVPHGALPEGKTHPDWIIPPRRRKRNAMMSVVKKSITFLSKLQTLT